MTQTVLDLFCGAGGFTLGCQQAGYDVIAGVDYDDQAIKTYNANFDHEGIQCNLAKVDPEVFAEMFDINPDDVDVIVGGPPCQGFSESNLSRDEDDPRNNLVFRFARYVKYYRPNSFVMENVVGIDTLDDGETIELLYEDFQQSGYEVDHKIVNAANYGVPQKRRRLFFVGVREDVDGEPQFPDPTHEPLSEIDADSSSGGVVADD